MPSSYAKVQKHVSKKKGSKINALHENSRDSQRLRRAVGRDDKISRAAAVREKANEGFLLRILFFQDHIPQPIAPLPEAEIHALIVEYLKREDEALAALKAERRPGRPMSTRQQVLEQLQATEQKEYEAGYWMPDMTDENNLKQLEAWKGNWGGLGQVKFVRVEKNGVIKESAFPPKGAA
ncbi:translation machinery-associated protein 16 [Zalaria obscura]|uniref:Translation machinery-associated protein 16 n=1 Tax=Zalaria obscura TaxID=2024903 RepID=A0ACC3SP18_9PEZI